MDEERELVDSQQRLAQSIARAIHRDLPHTDDQAELAQAVEQAVRREAKAFERTIAYLRAAFLGILTLFTVVLTVALGSGVVRNSATLLTTAGLLFAASIALAVALKRGWYHPRLRKLLPLGDALIIIMMFSLLHRNASEVWMRAPVGMIALATAACGFLAVSGSLRLSRSSGPVATAFAALSWIVVGLLVGLPFVETGFIALTILAIGVMSMRLGGIVRRVIVNEVARLRYASLYMDAQEAVAAREQVLNMVSHDLRNPLNTIAMTTDLIREVPDKDRNYYLDMIIRAGNRMNRLIQDLLDVARLDRAHGRVSITPVETRLSTVVEETLEMMAPLALERGIALDAELPADLPFVRADPERIIQLFSNLLGNALKFTPRNGAVCIRASLMGDKVRVTVEDSGPGIPQQDLDNIFASFWQANNADRRGIGLGLTIARAIVEGHGEKIGVENKQEGGARFWFTLPVAQVVARR